MNEYKITMPEGWKPRAHNNCDFCKKDLVCHKHFGICPLSHAVPVKERGEEGIKMDIEKVGKDLCPYCAGPIAIRNPTGKCDHLYYPDYVNKDLKSTPAPLATAAKVEEPLAVLADRKGLEIAKIASYAYPVGWLIHFTQKRQNTYDWGGVYEIPDKDSDNVYTYTACEAKARAYLESLEDVKGGR